MDGKTILLGALADSVQEVNEMEPEQIEAAPHFGTRLNTGFIRGMGKRDNHFVMIQDIDRVFSDGELKDVTIPDTGTRKEAMIMISADF